MQQIERLEEESKLEREKATKYKREDVQGERQPPPRLNVVNFGPIQAVELLYHGNLETLMSLLPFGIVAVTIEKVAYTVIFQAG